LQTRQFTTGGPAAARIALALFVLGWIAIDMEPSARRANRELFYDFAGFILIVGSLIHVVRAFRRKVALELSPAGLTDRRKKKASLVPWSDVTAIRVHRFRLIVDNRITSKPLAFPLFEFNEKNRDIVQSVQSLFEAGREGPGPRAVFPPPPPSTGLSGAADAFGVTPAPAKAESFGVAHAPVQADAFGVTPAPAQADAFGVASAPAKADAFGVASAPAKADAFGVASAPAATQMLSEASGIDESRMDGGSDAQPQQDAPEPDAKRRRVFWLGLAAIALLSFVDLEWVGGGADRRPIFARVIFFGMLSAAWLFAQLFWTALSPGGSRGDADSR